jgi:hypothetical protein
MPKAPVNKVRLWCSSLGVLTAVSISRHEAEMKLAAFVPLLQDRFPTDAFTTASMEAVAVRCIKGFPTYPELVAYLADWWRANRPPPSPEVLRLMLPPPPTFRPEPTPEEREHVARVTRETVAALRSTVQPIDERRPSALHLSAGMLDRLNPLPNGRSRVDATTPAAAPVGAGYWPASNDDPDPDQPTAAA